LSLHQSSDAYQPTMQWAPLSLSPRARRQGCEARAEVKNEWSSTPTALHAIMSWAGTVLPFLFFVLGIVRLHRGWSDHSAVIEPEYVCVTVLVSGSIRRHPRCLLHLDGKHSSIHYDKSGTNCSCILAIVINRIAANCNYVSLMDKV